MPETKFGPLSSLVGRTFERDGDRMKIVHVVPRPEQYSPVEERVYIRLDDGRTGEMALSHLLRFLHGATEVHDGQG